MGKSLQTSEFRQVSEHFSHFETGEVHSDVKQKAQYSTIRFSVWGDSTTLEVGLKDEISIGRSSADDRVDIDLNPFNAQVLGVSRKHAVIKPLPSACVIIDLESTNGTLVNGKVLIPKQPYLLKSGDEIQIGGVYLQVLLY